MAIKERVTRLKQDLMVDSEKLKRAVFHAICTITESKNREG